MIKVRKERRGRALFLVPRCPYLVRESQAMPEAKTITFPDFSPFHALWIRILFGGEGMKLTLVRRAMHPSIDNVGPGLI
jgi:hypothetical protein